MVVHEPLPSLEGVPAFHESARRLYDLHIFCTLQLILQQKCYQENTSTYFPYISRLINMCQCYVLLSGVIRAEPS